MQPNPRTDDIDTLIARFYSVFDNRTGACAGVDEIASLFHEAGVIALRGAGGFQACSPIEFATPRVDLLRGGRLTGFHEWETAHESRVDGDLALRTSRYEKAGTMDGAPYAGKGTKFFQFIRMQGRWRILSLAWVDDE